ncbi:hypothetical protein [Roseburia sp. AF42-8]|uniref:hypothetical protein n=1 Tax=Roseburia sp. AF42-8 TaxID=2293137 RepID=UPI001FA8B21D|nr:hypothetical protein [Roseburia sp. AF42-8]
MNVIAERLKEIRPDIYLYGEGWNGGPSSLAEEKRAFKASAKKMPGIGMFNDDIRDTIKGSVFYDDHLASLMAAPIWKMHYAMALQEQSHIHR